MKAKKEKEKKKEEAKETVLARGAASCVTEKKKRKRNKKKKEVELGFKSLGGVCEDEMRDTSYSEVRRERVRSKISRDETKMEAMDE